MLHTQPVGDQLVTQPLQSVAECKKKTIKQKLQLKFVVCFFVDSRRLSSYFSFGVTETQSRNMKTC